MYELWIEVNKYKLSWKYSAFYQILLYHFVRLIHANITHIISSQSVLYWLRYLVFTMPARHLPSKLAYFGKKYYISNITRGFYKNPHPYPQKPATRSKGVGFHGYGWGLLKKTPGFPVTIPNCTSPCEHLSRESRIWSPQMHRDNVRWLWLWILNT